MPSLGWPASSLHNTVPNLYRLYRLGSSTADFPINIQSKATFYICMEYTSSKKPFFDNWLKTHFLRDWKRRFPIGIFSITFSDSPDLLKTGSFLMNLGLSKTVIEKSFETSSPQLQTHCSSCTDSTHIGLAAATTATAAAGARGQSVCYRHCPSPPVVWLPFTPQEQHRVGSMTSVHSQSVYVACFRTPATCCTDCRCSRTL